MHVSLFYPQDALETKSFGVPASNQENDRWTKNYNEMLNFSTDMPWNPYKALLDDELQSIVAVLVVGGGVFFSSVSEASRGNVGSSSLVSRDRGQSVVVQVKVHVRE